MTYTPSSYTIPSTTISILPATYLSSSDLKLIGYSEGLSCIILYDDGPVSGSRTAKVIDFNSLSSTPIDLILGSNIIT
jgi:hypothetical protein